MATREEIILDKVTNWAQDDLGLTLTRTQRTDFTVVAREIFTALREADWPLAITPRKRHKVSRRLVNIVGSTTTRQLDGTDLMQVIVDYRDDGSVEIVNANVLEAV